MAGSWSLTILVAAVLLAAANAADTYNVGGDATGWHNPNGNTTFYTAWASTHTFSVGDILVFNFVTGAHDVANVTQAVFDSCNIAGATNVATAGPVSITLTTPGMHYFLCTFSNGGHCSAGQKLAINVTPDDGTPPSSSPSPPGTPAGTPSPPGTPAGGTSPPPPPSSSASSLAATFMSVVAMGFMCLF